MRSQGVDDVSAVPSLQCMLDVRPTTNPSHTFELYLSMNLVRACALLWLTCLPACLSAPVPAQLLLRNLLRSHGRITSPQ